MVYLFWDASALSKRYAAEVGTATVDALFTQIPLAQMRIIVLGCTEAFAILVRKRNRGDISAPSYTTAVSALQNEVIYNLDFGILPVDSNVALASVRLIARHNINSTDAAILALFLQHADALAATGGTVVLAASDQRLIRAAIAEGLHTLNPEFIAPDDVAALLAAL